MSEIIRDLQKIMEDFISPWGKKGIGLKYFISDEATSPDGILYGFFKKWQVICWVIRQNNLKWFQETDFFSDKIGKEERCIWKILWFYSMAMYLKEILAGGEAAFELVPRELESVEGNKLSRAQSWIHIMAWVGWVLRDRLVPRPWWSGK